MDESTPKNIKSINEWERKIWCQGMGFKLITDRYLDFAWWLQSKLLNDL